MTGGPFPYARPIWVDRGCPFGITFIVAGAENRHNPAINQPSMQLSEIMQRRRTLPWIICRMDEGESYYPFWVHRSRAEILELIGEWDRALGIYREMVDRAGSCPDLECLALGRVSLGWLLHKKGDEPQALELLNKAEEYLGGRPAGDEYLSVLNKIGNIYNRLGENQRAVEIFDRSLELARRMGDRVCTSVTLNNLGNTWGDMGDYRRALEYYSQAYQIDLEAGDNYSASLDAGNMGWVYLEMEDRARALECWEKQMAWSEKFGDRHSVSIALGNMAAVHILQGDYQTGRWEVEARLKIAREMGDKKGQSLAYSYLASIHRACGERELAGEALTRAIGLAREIGLRNYLAVFLLEKADVLFEAGRPTEAEDICQESLEISEASGKADTAFKCRLLMARLLGTRQPQEGARQLEALRGKAWQQSQRAVISHELYRLTGEERHREEAREIYAQLYQRMPDDDYRKKLEELSR